jgi:hypothetical protein
MKRYKKWRLSRAELRLADAEHEFYHWIEPFHRRLGTISPSEKRHAEQRIEKARRHVEKLNGKVVRS